MEYLYILNIGKCNASNATKGFQKKKNAFVTNYEQLPMRKLNELTHFKRILDKIE